MRIRQLPGLLLPVLLLIALAAFGPTAAIGLPPPTTSPHYAAGGFGPRLFLLNPPADQPDAWDLLRSAPATPHAVFYGEGAELYIASGDDAANAQITAAGIPVRLLDAATQGKVYYFVDAEADLRVLAQPAAVVYADPQQRLIALPAEAEQAFLAALATHGARASLLLPAAIHWGERLPPTDRRLPPGWSAERLAYAGPTIAALLPQVTEAGVAALVADLSGEQPVAIGGRNVTLYTRYTFTSQVLDAGRYVYLFYEGLGLPVSYNTWVYGNYSGQNLVADLRGATHPERVWLVGGHLDSTSEIPYSSAPGADDNATGTAATLLIASVLRNYQFADTIRFVHFTGEEQGMWGSKGYVPALSASGVQVMGYVNLDMIGYDSNGDRIMEVHAGTRANSLDLAGRFIAANDRYGQGLRIELKREDATQFSDHSPFWNYGYAAFLAIEHFFDGATPRDRNPWYHTTGDRLARVNLNYAVRSARTALATIAESAGLLAGPAASPTATSTASPQPTATRTPTATAAWNCSERVSNGGFETDAGWTFALTASRAGYTTTQAHSGARSARLGVTPAAAAAPGSRAAEGEKRGEQERNLLGEAAPAGGSYSTAYQMMVIPASAESVTLSFWYRPGSQGTAGDWQRSLLLNADYTYLATLMHGLENSAEWRPQSFDLTPYRDRTVVLYFEVYNDDIASSPLAWLYLDDVSVQACAGASPTPTVTPTGTSTSTPTLTSTSTLTSTGTPTATRPVCRELASNGGFETDAAWVFPLTASQAGYTSAEAHSGVRALRLGLPRASTDSAVELPKIQPAAPSAAATPSYSSAYAAVAIPADAESANLSFWYRPAAQSLTGGDLQLVLLLDPFTFAIRETLHRRLEQADRWLSAAHDLTRYRGQNLLLYFSVYNDNIVSGPAAWMFVDDVSLLACAGPTPAPQRRVLWLPLIRR